MTTKYLLLLMGLLSFFSNIKAQQTKTDHQVTVDASLIWQELIDSAYVYLNEQQEICQTKYKMGTYENWFYDQDKGELTFSNSGQVKLSIKYESVGSVSLKSNTWLWSWANNTVDEKIKSEILKVRQYGEQKGFEKLTEPKWTAEEVDGWEMTAIAAYLLKAKGAYRVKDDKIYIFMIFKEMNMFE